jgi:hypothetical protein
LLLIDRSQIKRQFFLVQCSLCFTHFPVQFAQQFVGKGFQSFFRFLRRFGSFGMLAVVCLPNKLFALPFVFTALLNLLFFRYLIAFVYHLFAHFSIGGKGREVSPNRMSESTNFACAATSSP